MEEKSSAGETLEKTFDYQAYLRQKLDKALFSRCVDEDGNFYAVKIVTNLETLLETAAKTLETDFEDADSDFIAVPSEEMERCKSFILALSRAKEQLGLSPLANLTELNAWLDYAIEEAREVQESYEFDEDEIPTGENGEPLCSELYLDELACDVFGNICFEFNGSETYFANHIAATAARIAKQMTDDLNNSVIPNEDNILSFIAVFEEISSHELADMIQLEEDEFEELAESDPDYAEKHTLLLEAFTDMDKDARYTGINNGMFMGTLTGPDIRVESMTITAYTPGTNPRSMSYEEFKEDSSALLANAIKKLNEAKIKLDKTSDLRVILTNKFNKMKKDGYKDTVGLATDISAADRSLNAAWNKFYDAFRSLEETSARYDMWVKGSLNKVTYYLSGLPKDLGSAILVALGAAAEADNAANSAANGTRNVLALADKEQNRFEAGKGKAGTGRAALQNINSLRVTPEVIHTEELNTMEREKYTVRDSFGSSLGLKRYVGPEKDGYTYGWGHHANSNGDASLCEAQLLTNYAGIQYWTWKTCDEVFQKDIVKRESEVKSLLGDEITHLTQNQFDAIMQLYYVGCFSSVGAGFIARGDRAGWKNALYANKSMYHPRIDRALAMYYENDTSYYNLS